MHQNAARLIVEVRMRAVIDGNLTVDTDHIAAFKRMAVRSPRIWNAGADLGVKLIKRDVHGMSDTSRKNKSRQNHEASHAA